MKTLRHCLLLATVIVEMVSPSSVIAFSQPLDNRPPNQTQFNENQTLLSGKNIRIAPTAFRAFIRRFRPRQFSTGSRRFRLESNDIRHILTSHHPKFYDPTDRGSRQRQTFFDERMEPDDVVKAIESVFWEKREKIKNLGPNGGQVEGVVDGVTYVLGINRNGRIHQFYPK